MVTDSILDHSRVALARPRPAVTVVTAEACHHCEEARQWLADLAGRDHVTMTVVAADSAEGRNLVGEHRPAMFPLVLVAGRFFSAGRLPRRKLAHLLEDLGGRG